MSESESLKDFKQGLAALRYGCPRTGVAHLRKAIEHDRANPFYLSYYGLALGRAENDWATAEDLCYTAVLMRRNQPDLYLNLAEVYRRTKKLEDAVWILTNGLQFTKRDSRLVRALEKLGVRRPPVLSFLDRKHFLNRQLGKLRHRLEGQGKVSASESLRMTGS